MWREPLLVLAGLCTLGGGFLVPNNMVESKSRRCVHIRTHGMYASDCRNLELKDIPQNLNTNIETLDVTFNRIRELFNTSFVNYSYLRLLYLDDNSISYIETGAFDPIPDLEVLRLSWNSLHQIPDAIYSLPVLRKLTLNNNPFGGMLHFMDPLRSVEILDISNCRFTALPQLEALPRLVSLNASYNNIKDVNVQQLAPLCRLQELYLQGNRQMFRSSDSWCECTVLVRWAQMRHIRVQPDAAMLCPPSLPDVDNSTCFNNETDAIFQESSAVSRSCETQVAEYGSGPIRLKGSLLWTIGLMTACAVLLICFASVYFVRRRQRHFHNEDAGSEEESITKSRS